MLSDNERSGYDRFKAQEEQEKKVETSRIDAQKEAWEAEEHFKRQPVSPAPFDTHKDHQIRIRNAVNTRILNAKEEIRLKFERRDIEYLEQAQRRRTQGKTSRTPLPDADREKLKDAYRRAADRRKPPQKARDRDGR